MPLTSGTRLGPYEIVAPLGAGGMGEVYRARDSRLGREVAIKSLPASFAGDAERIARIEREARLLASINHPNIATIHGLEDVDGVPHLVLEFVDGETLAQRLARGPLPVKQTLEVCGQIAAAIEAAHERGIIHRDLKPGNVMLTPARRVKVLDLGLAKSLATSVLGPTDLSTSPTVAPGATALGVVLGTAPYMSPEQARGKEVGRGADVWAFGCVLYECLSGRPAFAGETASDVIAAILEREPDWSALPAATPPRLRDLVRRCLIRDVERRPHDIGDVRRELEAIGVELLASVTAAPVASAPSLAVLYFENPSGDDESAYFCAGITEDILTDLSKIRGLRVASRNAVQRYRGAAIDLAKVAGELGVANVLEGSVRRSGDRVRITVQLTSAHDGFQVWAERFDRTLQDVFAVQEEIAAAIASALSVALTPSETQAIARERPQDVRAYDLYLKGRERYGSYTDASLREALRLFRQALAIDPEYALAWAGVADCCGQLCQWGKEVDVGALTHEGLEAARKAIALDPRLPEGHKAESLNLRFIGDMEGARTSLLRALEADPHFVPALLNLTVDDFGRGNIAGAERHTRRVLQIDPQEPFACLWLSFATLYTGRYDEAIALGRRARELSNDAFYVTGYHTVRSVAMLTRGETAMAEQALHDAAVDGTRPDDLRAIEAAIAARSGQTDHARALVHQLDAMPGLGAMSLMIAAGAAVRVGEFEIARRFLNRTLMNTLAATCARLDPATHPLLDQAPFAPRRRDATLVWPLEAPMIDATGFALWREVRIDSGLPPGSGMPRA